MRSTFSNSSATLSPRAWLGRPLEPTNAILDRRLYWRRWHEPILMIDFTGE